MNRVQKLYNWLKSIHAPDWYVVLMQKLQDIVWGIITQVAQENITKIKVKIIDVSKMEELNNQQKFQMVKLFCIELLPTIKDSSINLLIELLVNQLKKDRVL